MRMPSDIPNRATSPYGNARLHLGDAFTLLAQHYVQQHAAVRSTSALAHHAGHHNIDVRPLYDQVVRMEEDASAAHNLFEKYVWALAGDPKAKAEVLALLGAVAVSPPEQED